jgi:tRNA-binding protein
MQISYNDFEKVDIRVGKIMEVKDFPEAKKPSYKLKVDFGKEIGIKNSSAQLCGNYKKEDLLGRLVVAVVNFPPKQIANFMSEVLILGVPDKNKECILLKPEKKVKLGVRMY